MRCNLSFSLLLVFMSTSIPLLAEDNILAEAFVDEKMGVDIRDRSFPWQLLIDRGKLNGCVYKDRYYSPGAILIEDNLPRKCEIDANRDGYWTPLDERELEFFEAAVKSQLAADAELLSVRGQALSQYEMRMVEIMRNRDRWEASQKKKNESK